MNNVVIIPKFFPRRHPRHGEKTYFAEKIRIGLSAMDGFFPRSVNEMRKALPSPVNAKYHVILPGRRFNVGDKISLRYWTSPTSPDKKHKKQNFVAAYQTVKKTWDFRVTREDDDGEHDWTFFKLNGKHLACYANETHNNKTLMEISKNEGFDNFVDFFDWHNPPGHAVKDMQIVCWNDKIDY